MIVDAVDDDHFVYDAMPNTDADADHDDDDYDVAYRYTIFLCYLWFEL